MSVLAPVATKSSVSDSQLFVPSKVLEKVFEVEPAVAKMESGISGLYIDELPRSKVSR